MIKLAPHPDIETAVWHQIAGILDGIERDHDARILFAIESGSRAWGFPSPDSDYDVRFVYARPLDWYLTIERRRDVIELPIEADMDVNGWDIRKALQLLCKPNPVLLEWLESPIVYRETPWVTERLRALADASLHRPAASHHYRSLAYGQYRQYIHGKDSVPLKKYFYALRPALALAWMRENGERRVPMTLPELLAGVTLPDEVTGFLDELLERKKATKELGDGPRFPALDAFIEAEMDRVDSGKKRGTAERRDLWAAADKLFREIVLDIGTRT